MNLHEYQGKELLSSFGVRIQRGVVAQNADEAVATRKIRPEKQRSDEFGRSYPK